jgi:hypothetical protein
VQRPERYGKDDRGTIRIGDDAKRKYYMKTP